MPTEDPRIDAPRRGRELELFGPAAAGRSFRRPPPLVVPPEAPSHRFWPLSRLWPLSRFWPPHWSGQLNRLWQLSRLWLLRHLRPLRRCWPLHLFWPLRPEATKWSVDEDADLRRARLTVALVCVAAAATLVTFIVVAHHRDAGPVMSASDPLTPDLPTLPVLPVLPVPASVEPASSYPPPTYGTVAPPPPSRVATRTPKVSATPVVTTLTVGSVVSLQLADRPGMLVRHQERSARLAEVGPGSTAEDRSDATFKVVKAAGGCLSLESLNRPGFFLRHYAFKLRLDRNDDTEQFQQDSAFCQLDAGSGAIALRSVNFPDRFITEDDGELDLAEVDQSAATRFRVMPPA